MIHWQIERDEKGEPLRLVWSSAIQAMGEARVAEDERKRAELKKLKPMPAMREWARASGL